MVKSRKINPAQWVYATFSYESRYYPAELQVGSENIVVSIPEDLRKAIAENEAKQIKGLHATILLTCAVKPK